VFGVGGFGGVTLGVGVPDVGVFDEAPSEDDFEFDELEASGFGAVGSLEACFDGGCNSLTVLSPVPDLDLSAGATAVGDVTGAGVQLGASSGIKGAVAGAGAGSSARREAAEPNKARARPPASAHQRARDARTVDASTGKKSIEFGPAFPDALRDTSRLASSRSSVTRGNGDLGRKDRRLNAARIGSAGTGV
jgi:succinate dehydrogenase/fumarate reductase flavoprotein subunit